MEGSASQAGFYYQNNIAALKILEALFFESDIRQVRLENYEKGHHIDDVIVYREGHTDYYQIKWSEDADNAFTLFNLLAPQAGKKSIFKQLAEGYSSVAASGYDFSITLVTTKRESSQKRPSEGLPHSLPQIRQRIFEELKTSAGTLEDLADFDTYKDSLEKIRTECGLTVEEFPDFIRRLNFEFSQPDSPQIQGAIRNRMEALGLEVSLMEKLLNAVVKWSISGESVTKESLLGELGVLGRFEDKLSQFFRIVGDEHYVPNRDLFERLDVALNELDGGYILIEGLPGSGKSTALTKFSFGNPELSLAYYCFIPDTQHDFGEWRHQGHFFLKSLCIAIEKQFPEVDLPIRYSDKWDEKFWLYIDKLSQLGRPVVFIIDGLDHVHRDTPVGEASMLHRIKGTLPENIYFVLSSQYVSVLTPSVRLEVESDPRRHIKVLPFSQQEIKEYLENKGIDTHGILDLVEQKSGGIPVYLHYISEMLVKVDSKKHGIHWRAFLRCSTARSTPTMLTCTRPYRTIPWHDGFWPFWPTAARTVRWKP